MRKICLLISSALMVLFVGYHEVNEQNLPVLTDKSADFSGIIDAADLPSLKYWRDEVIQGKGMRELELKLKLQDIKKIKDCTFMRQMTESDVIINVDGDRWLHDTISNSRKVYVYLTKEQRFVGSGRIKELPIESIQAIRFGHEKNSD
ncbi:hypothetical protein PM729_12370 [Enterococcus mundtii]|uniref:hypothetical protein n=1 Tax=Enterococcus mundtii TaxID=53346 RepID=UPI00232B6002|nr:hypothetical protein [Enterococcus mundtii]MDB7088486.1 hypothetical protein [Enterococcus mundtii]